MAGGSAVGLLRSDMQLRVGRGLFGLMEYEGGGRSNEYVMAGILYRCLWLPEPRKGVSRSV